MRRILLATLGAIGLTLAVAVAAPVFAADADPTVQQIYDEAKAGHLDKAQEMMSQVLADHPTSARAHYVQAELYAKAGKTTLARSELSAAEQLKPGLPFADARSVLELKAQLGLVSRVSNGNRVISSTARPEGGLLRSEPSAPRFPWGTVLILVGVVAVLYMVFRRRTPTQYPMASGPGAAPGSYGAGGYGPPPMGGGGGIGSGIAGGLASGLAVGAGVVAGEELAHHFLDGGRPSGGIIPPAEAGESGFSNSDMGGSDFGVNDPGSSWDDGGGIGGGDSGGGGDWS